MIRRIWNDKRILLIGLGIICQGFTFEENYVMPVLYGLLWLGAVRLHRNYRVVPRGLEQLLTMLGIVAAYWVGPIFAYNRLVFIGNGLVVFQLLRLLYPLNRSEKRWTVVVAIVHLAIGSQVIAHYSFILVLVLTLICIPGALFQIEAERFRQVAAGRVSPLQRRDYLVLAVLAAVFFLAFPRFRIMSTGRMGISRGRMQEEIDMSDVASAPSDQLIFRIEGENIGLLRTWAMDTFDGRRWKTSPYALKEARRLEYGPADGSGFRRVTVVSRSALRNALPTDGRVLGIEGDFIQRPYVAEIGIALLRYRPREAPKYTYYMTTDRRGEELTEKERRRCVAAPEPSPALRQWVDQTVGDARQPTAIATRLVEALRTTCEYDLGAPALDEDAPVDDFVLESRRGHCTRFASALAYMLRLRGVPSRLVIGFIPREHNDLAGFYNIRSRHAHAWVEAWIAGQGWTTFDATPFGVDIQPERRTLGLTLYEWFEYNWYSRVVEFNSADQNRLADAVVGGIADVGGFLLDHLRWIALACLLLTAGGVLWRFRHWRLRLPRGNRRRRQLTLREARDFYGRMLRALAKQDWRRPAWETPAEFRDRLLAAGHPAGDDIRLVTDTFCDLRYGGRDLDEPRRQAVESAVKRIRGSHPQ